MKQSLLLLLGVLTLALVWQAPPALAAQITLTNPGFETGTLSGWTVSGGTAQVVQAYQTFTPKAGRYFAIVKAGCHSTTLSQTFAAQAGDTVAGYAFFKANDSMPFNDNAKVQIVQNGAVLFSSSVAQVGDYGRTPWTSYTYTIPSAGTYTLQGVSTNTLDCGVASVLGMDADVAPAATALAVAPASGVAGGTTTLSATLTTSGVALSGKNVAFTLNGQSVGTAATGSTGVATLSTVSLVGIGNGTYSSGVGATFAGDSAHVASAGTASLTVTSGPIITTQPISQTVVVGGTATFTAAASGNPAPTVQWQVSTDGGTTFTAITGATSGTLSVANATSAQNNNQYRAVFTNSVGATTSNAAILTVTTLTPSSTITTQPMSQTVAAGGTATFTAAASGNPAPTVQWQVSTDGGTTWASIAGATTGTLTVTSATASENGNQYRAVFTTTAGSVTTAAAVLSVNGPPPAPPVGWIFGNVLDVTTGQPIPGAAVQVVNAPTIPIERPLGYNGYLFPALSLVDGDAGTNVYRIALLNLPPGYVLVGPAVQAVGVVRGLGAEANFHVRRDLYWVQVATAGATLWSGTDSQAIRLGVAPQWAYLEVIQTNGPRGEVFNPITHNWAWVDMGAVGPAGAPPAGQGVAK